MLMLSDLMEFVLGCARFAQAPIYAISVWATDDTVCRIYNWNMFGVVGDIRHREKKSERSNGICEPVRSTLDSLDRTVFRELLNLGSPK